MDEKVIPVKTLQTVGQEQRRGFTLATGEFVFVGETVSLYGHQYKMKQLCSFGPVIWQPIPQNEPEHFPEKPNAD